MGALRRAAPGGEIAVPTRSDEAGALYRRLKPPAHYAFRRTPPHRRHVVVTSGALVRMGDESTSTDTNSKLTVGGFVVAAANVNHSLPA